MKADTASVGVYEQSVVALARTFDLLIFEQRNPAHPKSADAYMEPLLLQSGRPCLVLPYIGVRSTRFESATIAWDGSTSAARALADAIPFLEKADRVELLTVREETDELRCPAARLSQHLTRHGIDMQCVALPQHDGTADIRLRCPNKQRSAKPR